MQHRRNCRGEFIFYGACSLALTAVLLALIHLAGIRDEEEYGVGVYSTLLNAKTMFAGSPALWTNLRGFGTTLPLGQSFYLDPTFYLWPQFSISTVLTLFWAKMAVGSYCLILWLRRLGASPLAAVLGAFCFTFSISVANSTVTDDWPSVLSSWALFPPILLLISSLPDAKHPWATGIGLGGVSGFWAANGHPGHLPVLAIPGLVYTVVLVARYPRIIGPLALAASISFVILLDDMYYIVQQFSLFPADISRGGYGPLSLHDYWMSLWRPFSFYRLFGWSSVHGFLAYFRGAFHKHSTRLPFIGLAFVVCIVVAAVGIRRVAPQQRIQVVGVLLAFLVALSLSLSPKSALRDMISAMWLFRDGVLIMGIAAGAVGLTLIRNARWGRYLTGALLLAQLFQSALVFGEPVLFGTCCDNENGVFPKAGIMTPAKRFFADAAKSFGPRMALSASLSGRMSLGRFDDQGIHSASDLSLAGIELLNGNFKGTSQDKITPSSGLWGGRILFPVSSFYNTRMLDIAGIGVVGLYRSELDGKPPLPGLVEISARKDNRGNEAVLFANPHAWQRVTLLPADRDLNGFPIAEEQPDCSGPTLLCTDFSGFPDPLPRQPRNVHVGRYVVSADIPASPTARVAFVSQSLRHGWHAEFNGRELTISPAANQVFLSVPIPTEKGRLTLTFDPGIRYWIFWLSLATLWLSIVAFPVLLLFLRLRGGARPKEGQIVQ